MSAKAIVTFTDAEGGADEWLVPLDIRAFIEPALSIDPKTLTIDPHGVLNSVSAKSLSIKRESLPRDLFNTISIVGPECYRINEVERGDDSIKIAVELQKIILADDLPPVRCRLDLGTRIAELPIQVDVAQGSAICRPAVYFVNVSKDMVAEGRLKEATGQRIMVSFNDGYPVSVDTIELLEGKGADYLNWQIIESNKGELYVWLERAPDDESFSGTFVISFESRNSADKESVLLPFQIVNCAIST